MEQVQVTSAGGAEAAVLVAIELSKANWLLAVYDPSTGKVSRRGVDGGDAGALIALVERCRRDAQGRAGEVVGAECVFEAGYDGFWLQRRLEQAGIACRVMDPASLKVDRRARRVKTDRVDAESLLRALQAWRRGDRHACSFVRVPSIEEEDARRPHRELARLTKERVGHVNRIKGLLALHGVRDYRPLRRDRRAALEALRTGCGKVLPLRCRQEIERELSRLELVLHHIAEVEAAMAEVAPLTSPAAEHIEGQFASRGHDMTEALEKLTCMGRETAVVLTREVLCRDFRDRRSLASFAGLTPSPYSSGRLQREQGVSKAGNAIVRARLVQLAWRWVRFQTGSDITAWFVARTGGNSKRSRRVAIVAVARKLLVALWRYATQGLVPAGARLRRSAA
ncbi:MAG: IS110 family transposase [Rhodospirillales bacterium]|nr:IS110 family transposase [Rhodospirillales bacterium]